MAAFQQLAHNCLGHFLANAEGVRSADDPEYIHQARVALRRLRALLKVFSPLLTPVFYASYNEGWRFFANQLGEARDYDVLAEETLPEIGRHYEGHDAIETFVEYVQATRLRARESARASFHLPALGQLTLRFLADLARLERRGSGTRLTAFAEDRLQKRLARIRRDVANLDGKSIDDLHRLRIQFKRLRYAVEFFSPLYPAAAIGTYTAALKSMQEKLGQINDFERALVVESKAPEAVRCELLAGWLSASQQTRIKALSKAARRFAALRSPWENGKSTNKGNRK